jgi:hypothetical protein
MMGFPNMHCPSIHSTSSDNLKGCINGNASREAYSEKCSKNSTDVLGFASPYNQNKTADNHIKININTSAGDIHAL